MLKVNKESKAKSIVEVVKDKKESKAKNIVKVKKEMVKSEDVKSPDTLFKEELLSQVKEMRDIFENTLNEITEVKVLLKSVKERLV